MFRPTFFSLLPACFGLATTSLWAAAELSPEDLEFFESRIRPVLAQECYECHAEDAKKIKGGLLLDRKAGWMEGGDSGEVIAPGNPDASLLVKMVEHDPDYDQMPPKSKLSPQQIADLREWVSRGAPDPRNEQLGEKLLESEFNLEERKTWWSLQPVRDPAVPEVANAEWPRTSYDHFILAGLEEKGWSPAPPAAPEHLLRRVSLDLTGLAPTEDELATFLADASPDAYEKAVDRLIASPHFGERWARHWMDSARFSETKAFEADYTMPRLHRYRDYLIRAFNEDVPFGRFVREQLAGDLLPEPRVSPESGLNESLAGPGFLFITDGQHGPPDIHADEARVFDSVIQATGVTFQGLTISCAKCHDHKFDAITAGDYYSLYGMLRSTRLHYANMADPELKEDAMKELRTVKDELVDGIFSHLEQEADGFAGLFVALEDLRRLPDHGAWVTQLRAKPENGESATEQAERFRQSIKPAVDRLAAMHKVDPAALTRWAVWAATPDPEPELAVLHQALNGAPFEALRTSAQKQETADTGQQFGLGGGSLGEWVASGPAFQPGLADPFVASPDDGQLFRTAVAAGATTGALSGRLDGVLRSPDFILDGKPVELWAKGRDVAVKLVVRSYELAGYGPTTGRLRVTLNTDEWQRVRFDTRLWEGEPAYLEIQHHAAVMHCVSASGGQPGVNPAAYAAVAVGTLPAWGQVWLNDEATTVPAPGDLAGVMARVIGPTRTGQADPASLEVLGALFRARLLSPGIEEDPELRKMLNRFRSAADRVPEPVYARSAVDGDPQDTPVYLRGDYRNPSDDPNPRRFLDGLDGTPFSGPGSGRLDWADEVASKDNPLTARVRVNRIWNRLFGRGIVASVDDFGAMGEQPSHPALLDHLARDFMESGWSTKTLIRKIVLSQAYRMSSTPDPGALATDPKNASLHHFPVLRMDAESIRDHILHCSGRLDRTVHGPSVPSYVEDQPRSRAFPGRKAPLDGAGRRSVYLELRRNFMPTFLRTFDMPNASETTGHRHSTNVPGQALALMNDPFVHEQARVWARALIERSGDLGERLRIIHRQAFSREAEAADLEWGQAALEAFADTGSEEDIWTALCHLIINRKEFIYVR